MGKIERKEEHVPLSAERSGRRTLEERVANELLGISLREQECERRLIATVGGRFGST